MDSESRPSSRCSSRAVSDDRRFIVTHVAARALQTGALGAAVSYPAINLLRQDAFALRLPHMLRSVGRFAAAGAPFGLALGALRLVGEPDWFVRSCAESLRADLDRRRLNTFTLVGACAGGVMTALIPTKHAGPILSRVTGGGAYGGAAGFVAFLAFGGRLDILNWYGVPVW